MNIYCQENSETSLSEQIGFMFKIIDNDNQNKSLLNFDISRVESSMNRSLNVIFNFLIFLFFIFITYF